MTDLTPNEVLSDLPQSHVTNKTLYDRRPGHINLASDRANFAGCRMVTFTGDEVVGLEPADMQTFSDQLEEAFRAGKDVDDAAEVMNLYFSTRANLLVLNVFSGANGGIHVLITNQLDAEDLEEFQEVQQRVNLEMREWREKRDLKLAADIELAGEQKRLAAVGKKAETYNLFEKIRKLEAVVKKNGLKVDDAD